MRDGAITGSSAACRAASAAKRTKCRAASNSRSSSSRLLTVAISARTSAEPCEQQGDDREASDREHRRYRPQPLEAQAEVSDDPGEQEVQWRAASLRTSIRRTVNSAASASLSAALISSKEGRARAEYCNGCGTVRRGGANSTLAMTMPPI
jgi:hypothetical protein